eukprot:757908-Alexandrium_andersonii.AAC.1
MAPPRAQVSLGVAKGVLVACIGWCGSAQASLARRRFRTGWCHNRGLKGSAKKVAELEGR